LFEEDLRIRRKNRGEEHIQAATNLNNLVSDERELRNYQKAKEVAEEALRITRKNLGEDHIQVATSLNNLAFFE